jgi:hypothetical protein
MTTRLPGSGRRSGASSTSRGCGSDGGVTRTKPVEVHARAVPVPLERDWAVRISSPWTVAAIVAVFYALLMAPGLAQNPYQFVNIGTQYFKKGHSSSIIKEHARPIHHRIGYDGQFYYFLAVDPIHGKDYMDTPGIIYSRIGYPMTVRALSAGNATLVPYMMVLVNVLAAVGGTLAVAFFLKRHGLPPALALLYGLFPGLVLSVLRDLTEPLAFGLAAAALLAFDARSKRRLLASATLFGLAMLTRETVALFPAILALGLLVGMGTTARTWRERLRWKNLARSVAFAEIVFAPLFIWRHVVAAALPQTMIQEPFVGGEHHVASGAGGALLTALLPFHAIARQWPWDSENVSSLLTVFLPAVIWAAIAVVLLRRKISVGPLFVLANIAVFVVFLPTPIAVDYGSLGRASLGLVLAALITLPQVAESLRERAGLVQRSFVLWSLPFWLVVNILLNFVGHNYVW